MRTWSAILWTGLILPGLVGCGGRAKRMSQYPFFIETLDRRWNVVREKFQSENPDVGFVVILLKDLSGTEQALRASYNEANRDAAIAKLQEVTRDFREDLSDKVDLRFGSISLLPGATAEDVGKSVDKAYEHYLEFREMVKLD